MLMLVSLKDDGMPVLVFQFLLIACQSCILGSSSSSRCSGQWLRLGGLSAVVEEPWSWLMS